MPIDWLVLGSAFLGGLLGSGHCAAMCGGIATSLSIDRQGGWWPALQPNLGRIGGYTIAGAIAGGFGHGIVGLARMPGLGIALRSAVGIVLIVAALRLLDRRGHLSFLSRHGGKLWQRLRPLQQRLWPANTPGKRLALGMLWGWMPCGLSTTLLTAAWLQASASHGAMTMAAFGLGTLPVMLPLTWSGARIGQRLQRGGWRIAMGLLVLAAGLLTLAAPWLTGLPAMHGVLRALGCQSLPS